MRPDPYRIQVRHAVGTGVGPWRRARQRRSCSRSSRLDCSASRHHTRRTVHDHGSTRDIGAAVIGTGFIGTVHVEALRRIGVEVRGVLGCTPGPRRGARGARSRRARLRLARRAARRRPASQVVHVTSPNELHSPQVKAILAAGRHVVCEKPLAMTAGESARARRARGGDRPRQRGQLQHPLLPAQPARPRGRRVTAGSATSGSSPAATSRTGCSSTPTGTGASSPSGRRAPRRRRHRLALARPDDVPDRPARAGGHGRPDHVHPGPPPSRRGRSRRSRPSAPRRPSAVEIGTEDVATILLRFDSGARGPCRHLQLSAGPQEQPRSTRSTAPPSAVAWDSEQPEQLWIGHRDRPNELLLRNPALMNELGGQAARAARRPRRGLLRHVRRAVPARSTRTSLAGGPSAQPALPDVRRRPRRDARGRRHRRARATGRWVEVARDQVAATPRRFARCIRVRAATPGGFAPMKLGFLTAPFPETPLMEVADWAADAGFEVLEIACWPQATGADPPLRRHEPHRRREPVRSRRPGDPRRDRGQGPGHLRARLLPEPAPPRPRRTATRSSATSSS